MLDVVVIGAGYAGLAAALRLHDAGADFVVLEAAERAGGRVLVGRHWAGTETASTWHGYIDGAISSGYRAADEVL